ncbi:MAG: hypothetical protein NTY83_00375 [Candidatus Micrarchaeota archaeon]|nr:hypothetical protein [Candidatus Micrarchaeota archaeon]
MIRNIAFLAFALFLFGCASQSAKGTLEGRITIGPLCPVEPCHLTQEQIDQAYTSRSIIIYASDRATIVRQISIPPGGNYELELTPGRYFVTIRPGGIGDYPFQEIIVSSNQTTRLDLDVDTGIR